MSGVRDLYRMVHEGLEMQPGPEDSTFAELWEVYSDVTNLVGCRFMESRMGGSMAAAEEVRLYLARFSRVARISDGMPLTVPSHAMRGMKALGRLLESTRQVEELGEFVKLASPMVNDMSTYVAGQLGRFSRPVVDALTVVARTGSIMSECVWKAVPGLESGEDYS